MPTLVVDPRHWQTEDGHFLVDNPGLYRPGVGLMWVVKTDDDTIIVDWFASTNPRRRQAPPLVTTVILPPTYMCSSA